MPDEKARFARLLLEYRKSGEVPFSDENLSEHLIDFLYKMNAFEFEIAPEKVRDFLKAVSYTHLDVYKRQMPICTKRQLRRFYKASLPSIHTQRMAEVLPRTFSNTKPSLDLKPVSYTHLDVYKRQV